MLNRFNNGAEYSSKQPLMKFLQILTDCSFTIKVFPEEVFDRIKKSFNQKYKGNIFFQIYTYFRL